MRNCRVRDRAISHDGYRIAVPGGLGTAERFAFFGQVQALMGGFYFFAGERVEDAKCAVSFAPFVSHVLLCTRGSVTDFVMQSYLDRVSDPGRGERSRDPHSRTVLSRQRADESLIWNYVYRAL
jgi:hypothetical protein